MRQYGPAAREYDSFDPAHQMRYRPCTQIGWKPYRLTVAQRVGKGVGAGLRVAIVFLFSTLPLAAARAAGIVWDAASARLRPVATAPASARQSPPAGSPIRTVSQ